jgi:hypothetical protein
MIRRLPAMSRRAAFGALFLLVVALAVVCVALPAWFAP